VLPNDRAATVRHMDEDITADSVDLGGVRLDQLADLDDSVFGDALVALLARVDDPAASISGYNPQRLDG
jgi:hypothetical protein